MSQKEKIHMHAFRGAIIRPTLRHIGLYSYQAEVLLAGTLAQESDCFHTRYQDNGGPARGYYQMEPETHRDIWNNFLRSREELADKIKIYLPNYIKTEKERFHYLPHSDRYATAMARIHYVRKKEALPRADNVKALASYWKRHYNTYKGDGTEHEFIQHFYRCVRGS